MSDKLTSTPPTSEFNNDVRVNDKAPRRRTSQRFNGRLQVRSARFSTLYVNNSTPNSRHIVFKYVPVCMVLDAQSYFTSHNHDIHIVCSWPECFNYLFCVLICASACKSHFSRRRGRAVGINGLRSLERIKIYVEPERSCISGLVD